MGIDRARRRSITVFGGSRVQPGSDDYASAQRLGRLLAEHGLTVVSGGYGGVMEAVSRGAKEAGGHTIGVTVELLAQRCSPNQWVDEEIRAATLLERIATMIGLGSGYVVAPGGAGTMTELGLVWNLAMLGGLQGKPIVVIGKWERLLRSMMEQLHTVEADLSWLTFVDGPDSALGMIIQRSGGI